MSSKEMIDLDDSHLIRRVFEKLRKETTKVSLWQNLNKMRQVNFAFVDMFDFDRGRATLRPYYGKPFRLGMEDNIYFHSGYRNTIFKTDIIIKKSFSLEISLPEILKIQEERKELRRFLGKYSTFTTRIKVEGVEEEETVQIVDISRNGAGLAVSKKTFDQIEKNSYLAMVSEKAGHINGRIGLIKNKSIICEDQKIPDNLSYRIGISIIDY